MMRSIWNRYVYALSADRFPILYSNTVNLVDTAMLRVAMCRHLENFRWGASIRNRKFSSTFIPETPTASGWSPPTGVSTSPGAAPTLPFRVLRSKNRNLPVYTDYKSGRNQVLTSVRKIEGNVQVMEKMLRNYLNEKNLRSRVDELTGTIVFNGNHRRKIVKWLKQMGF